MVERYYYNISESELPGELVALTDNTKEELLSIIDQAIHDCDQMIESHKENSGISKVIDPAKLILDITTKAFLLGQSSAKLPETSEELPEELTKLLSELEPNELEVLKYRWGVNNGQPRTLEDVASHFNLDIDAVKWIERRGLQKLRNPVYEDD